ncbi:MAG: FAD-dependent oxidoreductase, partial [Dysgonamonadaceae bacterium]|nr:FAD-dependent oxidoreductase [Dysgonamonadaceae bacterium]
YIDATYEGDLMAQSGVSYTVGRESIADYNESSAGIQSYKLAKRYTTGEIAEIQTLKNAFPLDYVFASKETVGGSDNRVQAYTYRLCVTTNPNNQIVFNRPANYNPKRYNLILDRINKSQLYTLDKALTLYKLPNQKFDLNHADLVNASWEYPEASYERRAYLENYHKEYVQGLLYFMANDENVPAQLRNDVQRYGYAKDEFTGNGNFPYLLYVREARRMIGQTIMKQQDAWNTPTKPDAIGIGSYFMDCHTVERFITPENELWEEGEMKHAPYRPYEMPYGALVPKQTECSNLLVTICMSATHTIYGSLRMEPTFMINGQAAATAATLAANNNLAIQQINIQQLQTRLTAQGQILHFQSGDAFYIDKEAISGIVLDDEEAVLKGNWSHSVAAGPFLMYSYRFAQQSATETATAQYNLNLPDDGDYEVQIMYSPAVNRSKKARVVISGSQSDEIAYVDMTQNFTAPNYWRSLGIYHFSKTGNPKITISNQGENGIVIADGVRLIKQAEKLNVITYPMPAGEPASEAFAVKVEDITVPVYIAKVAPLEPALRWKAMDDKVNSALYFDKASFAYFDISGEASVKVNSIKKINSVKILPASAGVTAEIINNAIHFPIRPGQKLTVEINGDIIHSLHVFANAIETGKPDPNDPNVVYYGPGVHEITRLILRNNKTLYLAGGAILKTVIGAEETAPYNPSITLIGDNIKVRGRGIIDASAIPTLGRNMLLLQGTNISMEGVILRDAAVWTMPVMKSQNVSIDNLKILGYRANSDGIDICNSQDVLVENCFIRTLDDLIVVKTQKDKGVCKNITIRKNVLWNEVAHALSVGAEINDDITGVFFSDCDIIHDQGREWSLRVYHCDDALVKNIRFENIRVEESKKFISLWINKAVWSSEGSERGHIEDVYFKDITATGNPANVQLLGYGEENLINNIHFNKVIINGIPLTLEEIEQNDYVTNLTVDDSDTAFGTVFKKTDESLNLYPNPVSNLLYFNRSNEYLMSGVSVYNLCGRKMKTTLIANNCMDVSDLTAGYYLIEIG